MFSLFSGTATHARSGKNIAEFKELIVKLPGSLVLLGVLPLVLNRIVLNRILYLILRQARPMPIPDSAACPPSLSGLRSVAGHYSIQFLFLIIL